MTNAGFFRSPPPRWFFGGKGEGTPGRGQAAGAGRYPLWTVFLLIHDSTFNLHSAGNTSCQLERSQFAETSSEKEPAREVVLRQAVRQVWQQSLL